jgi:DUF2075 family protein
MRLYSGTSAQFIQDSTRNQIADKLKEAFFEYFRYNPSLNEINSWRHSLMAVSSVFNESKLLDHGVLLEYQLPLSSKRLDCMVTGKDKRGVDNAVIIELKQWEKCKDSDCENEVMTWVGGAEREVLHPSAQVAQYKMYLQDSHTAFYEGDAPIELSACAYLHNYPKNKTDVIFFEKFERLLKENPLFTKDDVPSLEEYLISKLEKGKGLDVLEKVEKSKYRPSKKLMSHVAGVIKGKSEYVLLDEQLVVFDRVLTSAKQALGNKKKSIVIIKGGPGTGKSVIAINLMAELLAKEFNTHYVTGSRAFTETLRKIIGTKGSAQFKYFNSFAKAERHEVDVLICDEAHRIRETSNSRFTKKENRSNLPQVEELLKAGKLCVFFLDDDQVVRPGEIGSTKYLKETALKQGCSIHEYELEAQFRCSGSDGFVNWINNTLGIKRTANVIWNSGKEEFDFKVFDSPEALETAIREKVNEGVTGRVTAGFCWKWSNANPDGTLQDDVVIGDYKRPWDARPEAKKLAPGIPKASLWAHDPNGINQIGCVYTAQGFEFDYVGVIFGKDLIYNFDNQSWEGHKENNADTMVKRSKDKFVDLVKNTYRVLLSRGLKGCYVYFMDKDTERFFKSRMELSYENESFSTQKAAEEAIEDYK